MTSEQLTDSISQIKALWVGWQANDEQVALWRRRLSSFDRDSVKQAIDEYKAGVKGSFKEPELYELLTECKHFQKKLRPVAPESLENDVFYGEEAKQRAYRKILAGSDSPGRRWLVKHLAGKKAETENGEPVLLGDALDDIPF